MARKAEAQLSETKQSTNQLENGDHESPRTIENREKTIHTAGTR